MDSLLGQNIGRYRILETIGSGGMAVVYKAEDTHLDSLVAVKVIQPGIQQEEKILKRFEREAKMLARLTHPNIVRTIDYGAWNGRPFLVMTYLGGGTLKERLGSPVPPYEATQRLAPVAMALHSAHLMGIIHRDVKPSNILLTEHGDPMLSDFGVARLIDSEDRTQLTSTGAGIGTPDYMSPEQWEGNAGPASDQYALGVVLYEMLTGRKPFAADTPVAAMRRHVLEPVPPPKQFVTGLPREVDTILYRSLAKQPEQRFPDMTAFADALRHVPPPKERKASRHIFALSVEKTSFSGEKTPEPGVKTPADKTPTPPGRQPGLKLPWLHPAAEKTPIPPGVKTPTPSGKTPKPTSPLPPTADLPTSEAGPEAGLEALSQAAPSLEMALEASFGAVPENPPAQVEYQPFTQTQQVRVKAFRFPWKWTGIVALLVLLSVGGLWVLRQPWTPELVERPGVFQVTTMPTQAATSVAAAEATLTPQPTDSPARNLFPTFRLDMVSRGIGPDNFAYIRPIGQISYADVPVTNQQQRSILFSPDGKRIAIISQYRGTELWNLETGELVFWQSMAKGSTGAFSEDGTYLAVADQMRVRLLSAGSGNFLSETVYPDNPPGGSIFLRFSSDQQMILVGVGLHGYALRMRDLAIVTSWNFNHEWDQILQSERAGQLGDIFQNSTLPEIRYIDGNATHWFLDEIRYDFQTGELLLFGDGRGEVTVSRDESQVLTSSGLWDYASGDKLFSLGLCNQLSFSPDRKMVFSYCEGPIYLNVNDDSNQYKDIANPYGQVMSQAWSPDGRFFAALESTGDVVFFGYSGEAQGDLQEYKMGMAAGVVDRVSAKNMRMLGGYARDDQVPEGRTITSLAFSPDGSHISASWLGGGLDVWDLYEGKKELHNDSFQGRMIVYTSDGKRIVTVNDGQVELWNMESGSLIKARQLQPEKNSGSQEFITILIKDNKTLAYAYGLNVFVLDGETLETVYAESLVESWNEYLSSEQGGPYRSSYENGRLPVVHGVGPTGEEWYVDGFRYNRTTGQWLDYGSGANESALSPDGKLLASNSALFAVEGGKKIRDLLLFEKLKFSHDSTMIASAEGTRLRISGVEDGASWRDIDDWSWNITCLTFSPDGKALAVGDEAGNLLFYGIPGGQSEQREPAVSLAELPDFTRQLAARTVIPGTFKTARPIGKIAFTGGDGVLNDKKAIVLSPDGSLAAVISQTQGVELWNLDRHEEVMYLDKANGKTGAFTEDGRYLIVASLSGISEWSVESGELIQQARYPDETTGQNVFLRILPGGETVAVGVGLHAYLFQRPDFSVISHDFKYKWEGVRRADGELKAKYPEGSWPSIRDVDAQGQRWLVDGLRFTIDTGRHVSYTSEPGVADISPDESLIATHDRLIDFDTGNEVAEWFVRVHDLIQFSPDGKLIFSTESSIVFLHPTEAPQDFVELPPLPAGIINQAWSPDLRYFAVLLTTGDVVFYGVP